MISMLLLITIVFLYGSTNTSILDTSTNSTSNTNRIVLLNKYDDSNSNSNRVIVCVV